MKKTAALIVFCFSLLNISAQLETQAQRIPASEKAIPAMALEVFKRQYPDVLVKSWYVTHISYWQNDISAGWYNDWYGPRTVVIYTYEKPNYFEVEFIEEPGEVSRAIYNKYGYWYETRTRIAGLPKEVADALKNSIYGEWKKSTMIERIRSIDWKEPIYRLKVSKGLKSKILRITASGEIFQEKSI